MNKRQIKKTAKGICERYKTASYEEAPTLFKRIVQLANQYYGDEEDIVQLANQYYGDEEDKPRKIRISDFLSEPKTMPEDWERNNSK